MLSRLNSSIRDGSLSARIQGRIAQERTLLANWICCKPYSEPLSGSAATNSTKNEITPATDFPLPAMVLGVAPVRDQVRTAHGDNRDENAHGKSRLGVDLFLVQ